MPDGVRLSRCGGPFIVLVGLACSHSSPVSVTDPARLGPFGSGTDVQVTFNPGQDYWPAYTEDGGGVLYQYSQPGRFDDDRCIGLLPAAGGTQIWHLCDNRVSQVDSANSFSAYALGMTGDCSISKRSRRSMRKCRSKHRSGLRIRRSPSSAACWPPCR